MTTANGNGGAPGVPPEPWANINVKFAGGVKLHVETSHLAILLVMSQESDGTRPAQEIRAEIPWPAWYMIRARVTRPRKAPSLQKGIRNEDRINPNLR